ncbi:hypothetical protein P170DRAFT_440553 [Aspergillus steynii IBT 23096]|uniref:NAD-dependent epimerase/dehydratase domain-containing protein n=1 Tax=Aspergillus steynii IBT 23096 TaxID=1392250 RepID=A0A2I2FUB4_9EURO|nr:uncharacterized protein P170DRAFT_440553 [Aspergillus steynii IBT 23096]PLB44235.1 hypothetical protein P170DRAFT_440553 [Aspergillus steynii IBT 23096]
MVSAAVIGCTGLVGSYITKSLISSPAITRIHTFSRRSLEDPASASPSKLTSYVSNDTSKWVDELSRLPSPPDLFFSAFGTTRAAAGGFENQYRIEHGLHLDLARAAKHAGCKVFVLVSSSFANHNSWLPYARMKGEIEENIKAPNFEHTVILHPGMIVGSRSESRPAEAAAQALVGPLEH